MRTLKDLNLTEEEFNNIAEEIKYKKTKELYNEHKEHILNNQKYIGKCYKEKNSEKYLMVINARSTNDYRVDVLTFEFPIKFDKNYHLTKAFTADGIFANLNFDGITVEDYPLLCFNFHLKLKGDKIIDTLTEITKEEFYTKMNEYIKDLQNFLDSNNLDLAEDLRKEKI